MAAYHAIFDFQQILETLLSPSIHHLIVCRDIVILTCVNDRLLTQVQRLKVKADLSVIKKVKVMLR